MKQYMKAPVICQRHADGLHLMMDIAITPSGSVKPVEILHALHEQFGLAVNPVEARITRTGLFGRGRSLIDLVS